MSSHFHYCSQTGSETRIARVSRSHNWRRKPALRTVGQCSYRTAGPKVEGRCFPWENSFWKRNSNYVKEHQVHQNKFTEPLGAGELGRQTERQLGTPASHRHAERCREEKREWASCVLSSEQGIVVNKARKDFKKVFSAALLPEQGTWYCCYFWQMFT